MLIVLPLTIDDAPELEALEASVFGDGSWGHGGVSGSLIMPGVRGCKAGFVDRPIHETTDPIQQKAAMERYLGRNDVTDRRMAILGFGLYRFVTGVGGDKCTSNLGANENWGEGEILTIAVSNNHRRQGIGRAILEFLLDDALAEKIGVMHLEVAEHNRAARALYSKAGFSRVGERKKYYRDGSDAIAMSCVSLAKKE